MNKRSGWLQAVCITAIVLGSLGIAHNLLGLGMLTAVSIQDALTRPDGQASVDRWTHIVGPLLAAMKLTVSAGLLIGAVQSLRLRPSGRRLLLVAFWAAAIVELAFLATVSVHFVRARLFLSLGPLVVVTLAKTAFYVFGVVFLCRPKTRALFVGAANAATCRGAETPIAS